MSSCFVGHSPLPQLFAPITYVFGIHKTSIKHSDQRADISALVRSGSLPGVLAARRVYFREELLALVDPHDNGPRVSICQDYRMTLD